MHKHIGVSFNGTCQSLIINLRHQQHVVNRKLNSDLNITLILIICADSKTSSVLMRTTCTSHCKNNTDCALQRIPLVCSIWVHSRKALHSSCCVPFLLLFWDFLKTLTHLSNKDRSWNNAVQFPEGCTLYNKAGSNLWLGLLLINKQICLFWLCSWLGCIYVSRI